MKIAKTLILIGTGLLLMGNQSCEKQNGGEAVKPRKLKKIVDVGVVKSQLVDLPNGEKFDFQYVVNQQIYPVLSKSEGFFFRYKPPFDEMPSQIRQNVDFSRANLSEGDLRSLQLALNKIPAVQRFDEMSCLVNLPQFRIRGMVSSFELLNSTGLGIGFNANGSHGVGGIGLGFNVENYQLDMNMMATHPWTEAMYTAANVTAKQTRTRVEFTLPIANLLIDPSFYFQTPLARVSYNALESAVNQIKSQLDVLEEKSDITWSTRVLLAGEHEATILAGKLHNVKVGDVFEVYDFKTSWMSENGQAPVPCESRFIAEEGFRLVSTIKITEVNDETSIGFVVKETGYPMKMGALVKLKELATEVVSTQAANGK